MSAARNSHHLTVATDTPPRISVYQTQTEYFEPTSTNNSTYESRPKSGDVAKSPQSAEAGGSNTGLPGPLASDNRTGDE
ncbi:hypothetical protein BGZ89_002110 [Linnemannia elongata]|nr:hypothetical protein BGZ89_002110 [Linnemannia elongata]